MKYFKLIDGFPSDSKSMEIDGRKITFRKGQVLALPDDVNRRNMAGFVIEVKKKEKVSEPPKVQLIAEPEPVVEIEEPVKLEELVVEDKSEDNDQIAEEPSEEPIVDRTQWTKSEWIAHSETIGMMLSDSEKRLRKSYLIKKIEKYEGSSEE